MRTEAASPFHIPTWVILLVAAVNGLIYLFLVPPWQHYDEPGHFEYVWLMNRLNDVSSGKPVDYAIRREILASLIEYNFFRDMGWLPNQIEIDEPPWIGISQLADRSLYYLLASIPVRLLSFLDVTIQLYITRFTSWVLFLGTVWFARKAVQEWFGNTHPMTSMVPFLLALLPGFVDLMTAINDDVGAIVSFTLFFWISSSLIQGRVSFYKFLIFLFSVLICFLMKSTAWLAILLAPIVLVLTIPMRQQLEWTRIIGLALFGGALIYMMFSWRVHIPVYFYSNIAGGLRSEEQKTFLGKRVLVLENQSSLRQSIAVRDTKKMRGRVVTLGAWMWAEKETEASFFELSLDGVAVGGSKTIFLTTYPRFYQRHYFIPYDVRRGAIDLSFKSSLDDNLLYLDGLTLVDGIYLSAEEPQFADDKAKKVIWEGKSLPNMIRNASGEMYLPTISEGFRSVFSKGRIDDRYFWSLIDWDGAGWFYLESLRVIFRTFWGQFGWAHVNFFLKEIYTGLYIFTTISFLGIVVKLFGIPRKYWKLILFGALVIAGQFMIVLLRAAGTWDGYPLYPAVRYLFPAILPIGMVLVGGWLHVWRLIGIPNSDNSASKILIILLVVLSGFAYMSLVNFYYRGG